MLRITFPLRLLICPLYNQHAERLVQNLANENFVDLFMLAATPFGHDQSEHEVSGDLLSLSSLGE